jgi:modification methylase
MKYGTIYCDDCLKVMKKLPEKSIKTIVTSPPYNIRTSTNSNMKSNHSIKDRRSSKWPNASLRAGYDTHDDSMPHSDYVDWQRDCLTAMMRLLQDDGAIFYNHKWRVQNGLLQDRHDIVDGFPVRQVIIWQRSGGINFNPRYFLPTYEVIYLIAKPKFKLAPKANALGDVWSIPQEQNNPHPAPFPLKLAQRCVGSVNDGTVLDPFLGSGTTALAVELLGREWIGIDASSEDFHRR